MQIKTKLKNVNILKILVIYMRIFKNPYNFIQRNLHFFDFLKDLRKYESLTQNTNIPIKKADLYPRIYDKTEITGVDPIYYIQSTWCAKKIFNNKPQKHYDVGSHALMVGIISQFIPTTMIDIRPLSVTLQELSFTKGDITHLPFENNTINSLSSICVIEHIGLGRYGDSLDQFGTEKSVEELIRVLAKDGNLYISVPIDNRNKVYFNAHRAFTRDYVLKLFSTLKLIEEKYIYGSKMFDEYNQSKGFGTGLYHFSKK
jgi:SAM-dependent methyltransferase